MGGLGGFFPPLLLGFLRDHFHIIWPSFALLAFLSAVLWRTNAVVFLGQQQATELTLPASFTRTADRFRAGVTATFFTGLLVTAIVECPCHQGFFSVKDGSVSQGPPPRPLPQITLERDHAKLVAVGVKGS
jgi:hypothetical protein